MNLIRHQLGFSQTESRFPTKGTCLSRCVLPRRKRPVTGRTGMNSARPALRCVSKAATSAAFSQPGFQPPTVPAAGLSNWSTRQAEPHPRQPGSAVLVKCHLGRLRDLRPHSDSTLHSASPWKDMWLRETWTGFITPGSRVASLVATPRCATVRPPHVTQPTGRGST
jgi:hypothetical protein